MLIKSSKGGDLTAELMIRLRRIFQKLDWPIHPPIDEAEEIEFKVSLYDQYCMILSHLESDEQELILNLTEAFLYCSSLKYPAMIKQALRKIDPTVITAATNIILVPLVAPEDFGKVKSSTSWLYTCLTEILPEITLFHGKSRKGYNDPRLLNQQKTRTNTLLLVCDDFIGSGDTARKALKYYEAHLRVESDKVVVVTLVAQQAGIDAVKDLGYDITATVIRNRGISDSTQLDVPKAREIMKQIEAKLTVPRGYNFGYKMTEALVSMMRTPNNTFPVFWCNRMVDGTPWPSPFERK